ncbi:DctP family TRAP transporter solute-binding subunit [Lysinibacillus sp. 54212]|uniref:DctP family TRAP transporter solute-binding subunit n=1 Tax=Lysinibacillus sp. 54212 TaxID=3119829 RepID=UPI002FC72754
MKYFFTGGIVVILIFVSLIIYQDRRTSISSLPYDDEQNGLEDQIIIHFSHVVAENTPKGLAATKFAELVHEKTNGKVIIRVYPNGILYNDYNEFEALKNNDIQMIAPTFSKVTSYLPSWQVLDLPFIIESEDELKQVLSGPLQDQLLAQLGKQDIKGLKFWSNGFKQIASNDYPILEVEDFQNLPIRVMNSELLKEQFARLGATPIATSFGEVYNEIENKKIKAQDNTISNLYSKGFHTYEKHITLSNHGIMGYAVMMNESFWNGLDKDIQQQIVEALNEMSDWQFEQSILLNEKSLNELRTIDAVSIYTLTDEQKKAWKEKLSSIYSNSNRIIDDSYYKLLMEQLKISNGTK